MSIPSSSNTTILAIRLEIKIYPIPSSELYIMEIKPVISWLFE
jgi:hypothetical protein